MASRGAQGVESGVERIAPVDQLKSIGPGLVAGAADVDPTTVATMAVVGATTVFALSWLAVLMIPVLGIIQVISSKVGVVGKSDLQTLVRRRYSRRWRMVLLGSILAVTLLTLAADLEAGAAALGMLLHVRWEWLVLPVAAAVVALLLLGTYDEIQRVLKYVMLALFAYVAAAVLAHPHWGQVARHTFAPKLSLQRDYLAGALALLGTTLTSYVYVWQTIELAEEKPALAWLRPKEADALVGIVVAVAVFWFILVATGATLGVHHQKVQTAQDAARALEPVAGKLSSVVFGIGLLGSALLALPVLMGTIAYVVGAEFDWRRGLTEKVRHAGQFYAAIAVSIVAAVAVAFAGVSPIKLLFASSIAGGVATPLGLAFLVFVASDGDLMEGRPIAGWLKVVGLAITGLVAVVSVVYLVEQLVGGG